MNTSHNWVGSTVGNYAIEALLGQGGMATVYRGTDQQLHRPVAIKVLSAALAGDPDYVDRFRQEARLIANLRHPNIAQVYTFGEHAGATYMVQELLPGPTLEQRLKDLAAQGAPMPQHEVLDTIAQLAGALDAAHAVGVIHRDVKPANAIFNAQREVVLTDFGIARAADASRTATAAGVIMGTPGYIAPEQAVGSASLTPACDVYALGVVLFELLAGRLPFEADTAMGVVLKHLYDPPPAPTSVRPDLPRALDAVVMRALEKEPTARFPSAPALAQALAAAWPRAGAPAAAPAPDIHSQPTTVWVRPGPAQAVQPAQATQVNQTAPAPRPAATTTTRRIAAPAPAAASPAPAPAVPLAMDVTVRSRLLLPLALVLLAALGIGGVLALRGGGEPSAAVPAVDARAADATRTPDGASPAPDAGASAPVAAEATPAPTAALAANPFDGLRLLLADSATWTEQGQGEGNNVIDKLSDLQGALERGESKAAYDLVADMQNKIVELTSDGKMNPAPAETGLTYLSQIASAYGLSADSTDNTGGGDTGEGDAGKGKDKDKDDKGKDDKGKGKGKDG
ncbi:MAG TPA: serine/threonine-protein kinase [Roseiflexaceae bacterium]|nr:serine/threonine-protein kinase [Roseiflexaceae bacterium]